MVQSLRDLGYEFPTAVADLLDNSLTAGATKIAIQFAFNGRNSWVRIADNGRGMSPTRITEALRYGSEETYGKRDLGKFGLGLKTASMSQCRRLTVASRRKTTDISVRRLDLDEVSRRDRWEITDVDPADPRLVLPWAAGTVVLWEHLDRVLQYKDPNSEWARAGLRSLAERTDQHLGMVLHRFLEGTAHGGRTIELFINNSRVDPWDPFARDEPETIEFEGGELRIENPSGAGDVRYVGYVLPPKERFSSELAFRRAAGPKRWNRQQGFYIYRADRMIQSGGWSWMRTADEHTKLARMSVDFLPELDSAFGINVAKVRVTLPSEAKDLLEDPVSRLVKRAQQAYRSKGGEADPAPGAKNTSRSGGQRNPPSRRVAAALRSAAVKVDEARALERIASQVRKDAPEVANDIGW